MCRSSMWPLLPGQDFLQEYAPSLRRAERLSQWSTMETCIHATTLWSPNTFSAISMTDIWLRSQPRKSSESSAETSSIACLNTAAGVRSDLPVTANAQRTDSSIRPMASLGSIISARATENSSGTSMGLCVSWLTNSGRAGLPPIS